MRKPLKKKRGGGQRGKVTSAHLPNFVKTIRIGELSLGEVPNPKYPPHYALVPRFLRKVLGWN